jgi:hypothetical protein
MTRLTRDEISFLSVVPSPRLEVYGVICPHLYERVSISVEQSLPCALGTQTLILEYFDSPCLLFIHEYSPYLPFTFECFYPLGLSLTRYPPLTNNDMEIQQLLFKSQLEPPSQPFLLDLSNINNELIHSFDYINPIDL